MLTRCSDFLLGLVGHAKEAVTVVLCIDLLEKPVVPQHYTESLWCLSGVVFWLRRLVLSFWTQLIVRRYIRVLFVLVFGSSNSRCAVHARAPDEDADTGDLRVLFLPSCCLCRHHQRQMCLAPTASRSKIFSRVAS